MGITQVINLTDGAVEYTYPVTVTELNGKDISADPVVLSLGTPTHPGTFYTPDVTSHLGVSSTTVQLLIGASYKPQTGAYSVWYKITDSPEVVPRLTDLIVTIT